MKPHPGAQVLTEDVASRPDPSVQPAGGLLGWYTTAVGRRHVRAITTADSGLCVIDDADGGAFLVEPSLEGMAEARALAADYLALASERGAPQSRHPWPADSGSPQRGQS
jgi:hypothetical protein